MATANQTMNKWGMIAAVVASLSTAIPALVVGIGGKAETGEVYSMLRTSVLELAQEVRDLDKRMDKMEQTIARLEGRKEIPVVPVARESALRIHALEDGPTPVFGFPDLPAPPQAEKQSDVVERVSDQLPEGR